MWLPRHSAAQLASCPFSWSAWSGDLERARRSSALGIARGQARPWGRGAIQARWGSDLGAGRGIMTTCAGWPTRSTSQWARSAAASRVAGAGRGAWTGRRILWGGRGCAGGARAAGRPWLALSARPGEGARSLGAVPGLRRSSRDRMRSGSRSPADALDYKRVMIFKFRWSHPVWRVAIHT